MEKKLAVIVDNNKEVTTEIVNTEMCSSACDVAMETCSSESRDACGDGMSLVKAIEIKIQHRMKLCWILFSQIYFL